MPWRVGHCLLVNRRTRSDKARTHRPKLGINKGHANLQRMAHTCPVAVSKELITHICCRFECADLEMGSADVAHASLELIADLQRVQPRANHLGIENC